MVKKLHIAVLTHAIDEFEDAGYVLNEMLELWESRGLSCEVFKGADDTPPGADFAICHIDMTVVDEDYARLFDRFPLVINAEARDISRTVFSNQCMTENDVYPGPVIVKTDLKSGGVREMRLRARCGDPDATMEIQRPWRKVEYLPGYPVFENAAAVPRGVWRNANLVVEKFRPEAHDDGEYSVRHWLFLGDRGLYYQDFASEPIVKGRNATRRVVLDVADVPRELHEKRKTLGFDYGRFDFGIVDGEVILYDVNRTPGLSGREAESKKVSRLYPFLSDGLDTFRAKLAR